MVYFILFWSRDNAVHPQGTCNVWNVQSVETKETSHWPRRRPQHRNSSAGCFRLLARPDAYHPLCQSAIRTMYGVSTVSVIIFASFDGDWYSNLQLRGFKFVCLWNEPSPITRVQAKELPCGAEGNTELSACKFQRWMGARATHTTYCISLRSSSVREPRDPLLKVLTIAINMIQTEGKIRM